MDVWDTRAIASDTPRLMTMSAWGGTVPGARLILTYATARRIYDAHRGDTECALKEILPLIDAALRCGTVTTTNIRTTGQAA